MFWPCTFFPSRLLSVALQWHHSLTRAPARHSTSSLCVRLLYALRYLCIFLKLLVQLLDIVPGRKVLSSFCEGCISQVKKDMFP
jgi:hypothetical protein